MKLKNEYSNLFCVVGKSERNKLPHIISCSIGIDSESQAVRYSQQMSKMRCLFGGNKKQYEWTQPKLLSDALKDSDILIAPTDTHYIKKYLSTKN